MNIKWKYFIELQEKAIVWQEKKHGVTIPKDLEALLKYANAATPSLTRFTVNQKERVLGAILSFNPKEQEADSFETAMVINFNKNIIPFGIDPFGNYICYNTDDCSIVFFDHEKDKMEIITDSLKSFIEMLY